jgi:hypothetical protein
MAAFGVLHHRHVPSDPARAEVQKKALGTFRVVPVVTIPRSVKCWRNVTLCGPTAIADGAYPPQLLLGGLTQ